MADYLAEYRDIDISAVITMRDGVQITVPASDIYGYNITGTAAYNGLPLGEAIANSFSLSVSVIECPYSAEQLDSAEVRVRMGVRNNDAEDYEYSDAGAWYVTGVDAPEGGNAVTLRGVDALGIWFDGLFVDNAATYPQPMSELLETLALIPGVELSDREWLHKDAALDKMPAWAEGTTIRQAVGYIAACAGGFAQIDMSGKLEIITTGWGNEQPLNTAAYNTFTPTGGARFRLNALQVVYPITDEDADQPDSVRYAYDTAVADNATNCVVIEGNPLITDAMASAIVKELHRYEFIGGDLTWIGSPAVNCGSIVLLTPIDGNERVLYVNQRDLNFDGGLTGNLSSTMPTLHDTSAHYTSSGRVFNADGSLPVSKIEGFAGAVVNAMVGKFDRIIAGDITTDKLFAQIGHIVQLKVDNLEAGSIHGDKITAGTIGAEQLEAKSITADKIAAGSVTADKVAAGAITADKIAAYNITGNKIASDTITARNIQSGTITADLIAAKTITADSGIIDDAAISTAQIADGSITSAKIVELTADLIKTGTLSAERILIAGDDGIIYRINATSSGLSLSQLRDDQYKNYINGTVIVAKSITAAQIAAEAITANEILAGTITTKQINITELFANNAVIDAINTNVIRGNGYLQLIVNSAIDQSAEELQTQIDSISGTAEGLQSQIDTVSGTAESLQAQINLIPGNIQLAVSEVSERLQPQIDSVARTTDGLQSQINLIPGQIAIATGKVTTESKTYTDAKAAETNGYVDDKTTEAKEYTDTKASQLQTQIDTVSETTDELQSQIDLIPGQIVIATGKVTSESKTYTDAKAAETNGYIDDKTAEVKQYADTKAAETNGYADEKSAESKVYTDTKATQLQSQIDTVSETTESLQAQINLIPGRIEIATGNVATETKSYTDAKAAETNGYVDDKTTEAKEYTDTKATQLQSQIDTVSETTESLQSQINLIPGNIQLAVSNVTATGLKTGSGVSITKDEVTITSPKTKVTIPVEGSEDEAEIVSIDEDGLRADVITADEINSPSVVRVAAAANYAPTSAGELQTLLMEITGHFMSGDIVIDASAVAAGIFAIKGLHGYGVLTISGGSFNRVSVTDCSCRIVFDSIALATDGTAVEASNAKVLLKNVAFTAVEGLHAHHYAHVDMTSCTGECKTLLRSTDCAVVCVNGDSCPAGLPGELSGGGELYSTLTFTETVQEPDEGETGVVTTATIAANASRSWSGGWLSTSTFGTALYQGTTGDTALRRGCMWFDTSAIAGKHIISATLTIRRVSGIGSGSAIAVGIYGTTATGASGTPAIGTKYASVSISNGGKATVDVTTAVQDLADGNIGGLMTYDTRTSKISGKTYTVGYCKMYGSGETDAPTIEVTYE